MTAYYNEFDPFAADWLEELIKDNLIAPGIVDRRSILEVEPNDYKDFTQHHFFAGIGGWSRALRLAGWSDGRPVCTASLPCQPFSTAGNQLGKDDERHLLPHFIHLVRESHFDTIFGEQVENAVRLGWLDDLYTEMEGEGYAVGATILGAHSVNAPHQRKRIYWVAERLADTESHRDRGGLRQISGKNENKQAREEPRQDQAKQRLYGCESGERLDYSECERLERHGGANNATGKGAHSDRPSAAPSLSVDWGDCYYPEFRDGKRRPIPTESSILALLLDGISYRMGFSSNEDRKEKINGSTSEANSSQILQGVQQIDDKEKDRESARGFGCVQEESVLRQEMYGEKHGGTDFSAVSESQQETVAEAEKGFLRTMWENSYKQPTASCASQGLQPDEQHDWEFADLMLFLSSACSQADREGSEGASLLHRMREASKEAGLLPEALSAIEEVWQSVANKSENWEAQLRDCHRYFGRFTRFPLARSVPNRVGILRGAGNAIVPQVGAAFIKAFMEIDQ